MKRNINLAEAGAHLRDVLDLEGEAMVRTGMSEDLAEVAQAIIREHLAAKGLGLHCDLQNEHAIVGNNVGLLLMLEYGSAAQTAEWVDGLANGTRFFAFGITEPNHGSDATHMETRAVRDGDF